MIFIVDFGSQVTQLIARRVREAGVYCEIVSSKSLYKQILNRGCSGIVFSGGPASVHKSNTPKIDKRIFNLNLVLHLQGIKNQLSIKDHFLLMVLI